MSKDLYSENNLEYAKKFMFQHPDESDVRVLVGSLNIVDYIDISEFLKSEQNTEGVKCIMTLDPISTEYKCVRIKEAEDGSKMISMFTGYMFTENFIKLYKIYCDKVSDSMAMKCV